MKLTAQPLVAHHNLAGDGHTDARGGESYNLGLAERRAKSVVQYLSAQGVDTSKLAAQGFGKTKPKVSDPLDSANRRVETRIAF